jgi:hypothetical protein
MGELFGEMIRKSEATMPVEKADGFPWLIEG